mmetsp:Transcript_81286/g.206452  ORF Transcript_81286/g.206452 Transcript_81286/m.206452 type:complete len:255 (+) Transcript_81286:1461-2225(+)
MRSQLWCGRLWRLDRLARPAGQRPSLASPRLLRLAALRRRRLRRRPSGVRLAPARVLVAPARVDLPPRLERHLMVLDGLPKALQGLSALGLAAVGLQRTPLHELPVRRAGPCAACQCDDFAQRLGRQGQAAEARRRLLPGGQRRSSNLLTFATGRCRRRQFRPWRLPGRLPGRLPASTTAFRTTICHRPAAPPLLREQTRQLRGGGQGVASLRQQRRLPQGQSEAVASCGGRSSRRAAHGLTAAHRPRRVRAGM